MAIRIELISRKHKSRRKKRHRADDEFYFTVVSAFELAINAQHLKSSPFRISAKTLSINNFLVNSVTALEVYFKDIINENSQWAENSYDFLLKEKITLSDAYSLFKKENLTREFIISRYASFQNLENIGKIFSILTGSDFFSSIENHKMEFDDNKALRTTTLKEENPDWRKTLIRLFESRNRFVHEGYAQKISLREIKLIYQTVINFEIAIDEYLDSKYNITMQILLGKKFSPKKKS